MAKGLIAETKSLYNEIAGAAHDAAPAAINN
jgi:hypothetical protein